MKKRIISLLMCLVMAFSMVPAAAWAEVLPSAQDTPDSGAGTAGAYTTGEDTAVQTGTGTAVQAGEAAARIGDTEYTSLPAALGAAEDGDAVTLLANHTTDWDAIAAGDYSTVAVVKKQLTLDLNGFSVDSLSVGEEIVGEPTYDEEGEEIDQVAIIAGDLTVVNNSQGASGSIAELVFISGKLKLESGIIGEHLDDGTIGGRITCKEDDGNKNITDGTYGGEISITGGTVYSLYAKENVTVTVTGGTGHKGNWSNDTGKMTITGGSFADAHFYNNGGTIAISGGTFGNITNNNASGKIPLMPLLADGYAFYDQTTGTLLAGTEKALTNVEVKSHTHTVTDGACPCGAEFAASVTHGTDTAYYAALEKAFAAANDGDTITLLTDVALTETLSVQPNDQYVSNFKLDLNGKTISCNSGDTNTIFVSVTLTICDNSSGKTGKVTQNGLNAVQVGGSGTLIITGGSFGPVSVSSGGSAEINGGSFSEIWAFDRSGTAIAISSVLADGYAFYDQSSGEVQNGTATKLTNVTVKKHTHSGASCDCGYTCSHPRMDSATGNCADCGELIAQASVKTGESTVYYTQFTTAVDAAGEADGSTVTLLQDVTLPDDHEVYINKAYGQQVSFTIDWNGHTLSGRHYAYLLAISGAVNMTLKDSSGSNAGGVRNEYEIADRVGGIAVHVSVQNGYCVTIEGGTYSAQVVKYNCSGDLRIKGGVFKNPANAGVGYAVFSCDRNKIDTGALADLLADSCTFSYSADAADTDQLLDVYTTAHTDAGKTVYVVAHTHAYDSTTGKCVCGKPCEHTLDGTKCTSCGATFVAQVNGAYYTTVTEALDKAPSGGTVQLLTNSVTENVTFSADKSVTLDMAGKTLTAADTDHPALTVENGTLTVSGDAAFISPWVPIMSPAQLHPAILLTGGKLVFDGKLTAEGGYWGNTLNYFRRTFALKATGGELDFRGGLSLQGGLNIVGDVKLTQGLTQGIFWVDKDGKEISADATIKLEGTTKCLGDLLADGYAFVDTDPNSTNKFPCTGSNNRFCSYNVTIMEHTHTWGPGRGEYYACTECDEICDHPDGLAGGKCPVCGMPCPHAIADQSADYNYYCNKCHQQMFARIQTDTYKWAHFTNLADAMAAAENGQTVVLLSDIVVNDSVYIYDPDGKAQDITLDLNGKKITGSGSLDIGKKFAYPDPDILSAATLRIIGTGDIQTTYAVGVFEEATLDLSGWEGGTINIVTVSRNGVTNKEGTLIVGEHAGHINRLEFYSWPTTTITNAELLGGSYGLIDTTCNEYGKTLSLTDLLPEGYAFQYSDETYADRAELGQSISNVSVAKCLHTGFDALTADGKCPYCDTDEFAVLVETSDGVLTAYKSIYDADVRLQDGDTMTLLDNNADRLSIYDAITLDLNGFYAGMVDIYAPVKLRNSKTTGGEIPSLNIGREGIVLGDLLADGCSLKDRNTNEWLSASDLLGTSANEVMVAKTAVSAVSFLSYADTFSYGRSAMLSISTGGISCTFQWYELQNGTWNPIQCTNSNYSTPSTLSCGSYTYRCAVTDSHGATVLSGTATVTVTPADLSQATVTLDQSTFTYDPQNSVGFSPAVTSVRLDGPDVPKEAYTLGGDQTASQAGTYTLTLTAVDGSNYTGTASVSWTIDPCTLTGIRLVEPFKTYDGSLITEGNALDNAGQIFEYGVNSTVGLEKDSYTITLDEHTFTGANAGDGQVTFTVTLRDSNYTFKNAALEKVDTWKFTKPVTIAQAELAQETWPTTTLTVRNNWEKTYTLDISRLLPTLPAGQSYGTVEYKMGPVQMDTIYQAASPTVDAASGILTLSINSVDTDVEKQIGYVKVNVVTTNYETFEITVDLTAANKAVPAPNGALTASDITYGQKLGDSTITGEMQVNGQTINGTFAWDDPTDEPTAGTKTDLGWTFTPDASYGGEYASAAGTIDVQVNKAVMTASVEQGLSLIYNGTPQQAAVMTTTKTVDDTPAQYTYAREEAGPYGDMPTFTDAGSYKVWYRAEDFGGNHETVTGTFTVTIDKADPSVTAAPAANTLTYTGGEQALVTPGTAEGGTVLYSLDGVTYAAAVPTAKLPSTYTVYYKVQGDRNHNDTKPAAVAVTIAPAQLTNVSAAVPALTYNGKAQTPAVSVTAAAVDGTPVAVTYSETENGAYTAAIPSYSAVGSYTLFYRLTAANHEPVSGRLFVNVDKAQLTVPDITLDVTNGVAAGYTVDLQAALDKALPAGCQFGRITYGGLNFNDSADYCDAAASSISRKGLLTLVVNSVDSTAEGQVATVQAFITTDNYQDITVTVKLRAVNKVIPTGAPILSTRTIVGGQRLGDIALSGVMTAGDKTVRGTFAWAEPYFCPDAGSYTAAWVFTPDEAQYAVVTGTADITVTAPAQPTYTVSGEVLEYSVNGSAPERPASGATVTIRKGVELYGQPQQTDENGSFSIGHVLPGVYNVVVEYGDKIVTAMVQIIDKNETLTVKIPREQINSELEIKEPTELTEDAVVGGLDAEAAKRFSGVDSDSLSISMDLREVPANDGDPAQKTIRGKAEGMTLVFMDLSLTLTEKGGSSALPETETLLEIILSYDTGRSGITVLRSHNGEVQTLASRGLTGSGEGFYVDKANGRIHIFANKFSTYAIGYTTPGSPDSRPAVKDTTSPATGDAGLVVYAAMALSSCTGTALLLRRKREHE